MQIQTATHELLKRCSMLVYHQVIMCFEMVKGCVISLIMQPWSDDTLNKSGREIFFGVLLFYRKTVRFWCSWAMPLIFYPTSALKSWHVLMQWLLCLIDFNAGNLPTFMLSYYLCVHFGFLPLPLPNCAFIKASYGWEISFMHDTIIKYIIILWRSLSHVKKQGNSDGKNVTYN